MRYLFFWAIIILGPLAMATVAKAEGNCPMPITYTTGDNETDELNMFSDSVEWAVVEVIPDRGAGGTQIGWLAIVHPIAEGDEELESFITREDEQTQVFWGADWQLQQDFEVWLCRQ